MATGYNKEALYKQQIHIYTEKNPNPNSMKFMNVKGGIPTIDIIGYNPVNDNFFAETWHTQQDNLANIDKDLLQKVGEVLLQALYQENI